MTFDVTVTADDFLRFGKIERLWLKLSDRNLYNRLKYESRRVQIIRTLSGYNPPALLAPTGVARGGVSFKHSGNAGDIIYALPSVRTLSGGEGARLLLALDVPMREKSFQHPLGGVQLNRRMFDMLKPLLQQQEYLSEVEVWKGTGEVCDLDVFRDAPLLLDRLGICRWYFYMLGITCDLSRPWLVVEPDATYADCIVVARSARYRNHALSYRFLGKYPRIVFLGLEDEFKDFRQHVPAAELVRVEDFLEMARIIAGSKLFIGNQSFPFSIAEGLKVPRVVELDPTTPNVVPTGESGFDVLFQSQLEHIVKQCCG